MRVFTERRATRVVGDEHRQLEAFAQSLPERHVVPAEVRRIPDGAGCEIDVSRRADADARDCLVLGPRKDAVYRVLDGRNDDVRRVIDDVVAFPLDDLPVTVNQCRKDVRAA